MQFPIPVSMTVCICIVSLMATASSVRSDKAIKSVLKSSDVEHKKVILEASPKLKNKDIKSSASWIIALLCIIALSASLFTTAATPSYRPLACDVSKYTQLQPTLNKCLKWEIQENIGLFFSWLTGPSAKKRILLIDTSTSLGSASRTVVWLI